MSLGERIYILRTEKNLSQGDLAEQLEVSRQSISKWENNNAIPDLEKIIKLSEIFEVSLDELVKGEKASEKAEDASDILQTGEQKQEAYKAQAAENGFPPRKIAGTILFCMGFVELLFFTLMGAALGGLVFCLPFVVCGIICFVCRKNVGLWCTWAVYVMLDVFMSYATGISRSMITLTHLWTPQMNYGRLVFAWLLVLALGAIILVTVIRLGKKPLTAKEKGVNQLLIAWLWVFALQIITWGWGRSETYKFLIDNIMTMGIIYSLISLLLSWVKIIAFTVALVITVRFINMKKSNGIPKNKK